MEKFLTIDLFGHSILIENNLGQQILYTIEKLEDRFCCYQQKRNSKNGKWKKKRMVDSSSSYMEFEFAETEAGFRIEKYLSQFKELSTIGDSNGGGFGGAKTL